MESIIIANINDPEMLEKLYRENRISFESGFEKVYSDILCKTSALIIFAQFLQTEIGQVA